MSALDEKGALALLAAAGGYLVWALAFAVLYSAQGIVCAGAFGTTYVLGINAGTLVLAALWLAHLAAGVALLWTGWRLARTHRDDPQGAAAFLGRLGCLLAAAGLVSTLYIGAPVLALHPCA